MIEYEWMNEYFIPSWNYSDTLTNIKLNIPASLPEMLWYHFSVLFFPKPTTDLVPACVKKKKKCWREFPHVKYVQSNGLFVDGIFAVKTLKMFMEIPIMLALS